MYFHILAYCALIHLLAVSRSFFPASAPGAGLSPGLGPGPEAGYILIGPEIYPADLLYSIFLGPAVAG
jgi:hypothetical protein